MLVKKKPDCSDCFQELLQYPVDLVPFSLLCRINKKQTHCPDRHFSIRKQHSSILPVLITFPLMSREFELKVGVFSFIHSKAAKSAAINSGRHLLGTCFGDVRICLQEADAICRLSPTLRHYWSLIIGCEMVGLSVATQHPHSLRKETSRKPSVINVL